MSDKRDRVLALAGVFQACALVRQIAHEGRTDASAFEASIKSLLVVDAPDVPSVYGGVAGVRLGLEVLAFLFQAPHQQRDAEIAKYALAIMHLERKLLKRADLMDILAQGIRRAQEQAEMFGPLHENVIASLAHLYQETVSTIPPKIVVSGAQGHLMAAGNPEKVRALLLAAMRSAILWRQKGGRRWHILFQRQAQVKAAREILAGLNHAP